MPDADVTFQGQHVIIKIQGSLTTIGMQCSVDAVLGVYYTQCMVYSVYAVLGLYYTQCMLVYGVNSGSWHGEIERDDLTLCSAIMVEVVDVQERDGG
jgi:hypothetical protein